MQITQSLDDLKVELAILTEHNINSVYNKGVHKVSSTPALSTVSEEESAQASAKSHYSVKLATISGRSCGDHFDAKCKNVQHLFYLEKYTRNFFCLFPSIHVSIDIDFTIIQFLPPQKKNIVSFYYCSVVFKT